MEIKISRESASIVMKDRFSTYASQYAAFRPVYPPELYNFIFSHVKIFEAAWDAGTGNGQAAMAVAKWFNKVYATDISTKQLENASRAENIIYSLGDELINLPYHSVDLITVAQAIHWFNREKFYTEAKRVGKPGSLVAVWGYGLLSINQEIDPLLREFYVNIVGPYWDPERKLIDEQYRTIGFPFEEITSPPFTFSFEWTLEELQGYLTTWSVVHKYMSAHGINPVESLIGKIQPMWKKERQGVNFPLFLRCGRIK